MNIIFDENLQLNGVLYDYLQKAGDECVRREGLGRCADAGGVDLGCPIATMAKRGGQARKKALARRLAVASPDRTVERSDA